MKICIIGFPRSRSSLLLETISLHYDIPILGKDINDVKDRTDGYFQKITPLLETVLNTESGVIRLHPFQLATDPLLITDFSMFKFEQYDKIYFTFRESVTDNIASNFVAHSLKKFTYQSQGEVIDSPGPFYFRKQDHWHIRDYVHSMQIAEQLKDYMAEHRLPYDELYYNDIPRHLAERYPGTKSSHTETKYVYKHIIVNYNDIEKLYTGIKDVC